MVLPGWRVARNSTTSVSQAEWSNCRISEPNGTFIATVAPGHYTVTVDSYLSTYFYQFTDIDLAAGQEAYVKVLSQLRPVGERAVRENFTPR